MDATTALLDCPPKMQPWPADADAAANSPAPGECPLTDELLRRLREAGL